MKEHYYKKNIKINLKSLGIIVAEINEILRNKTIICHQSLSTIEIFRN